ncbi:MAG: YihY/virulence factor BrkB family protein [Muribaculaceae bacterium]
MAKDKKDNRDGKTSADKSAFQVPLLQRLIALGKKIINYCIDGVWSDTRSGLIVNVVKTVNLSVRSFFNADIQSTACAMAFRTLLATVPALALIFAIGRGFGFASLMQTSLFNYFPAQQEAIAKGLKFVDTYLESASEGIFVGIGIIMLLWTLISLVSSGESAFNKIWGVRQGRSFWRKLTDYTAIFLILPILMISFTGINILMSSTLQSLMPYPEFSPVISSLLDICGLVLTWLFFTGVYILVPNTKVKFTNALLAGVISGTCFTILQWLFVTGQVYVSKYNAIYGSFAFLPLVMIWLQFVWIITLAGAVICYASQNIFRYSFSSHISSISDVYRHKATVAVMAIIIKKFKAQDTAPDANMIAAEYGFPISLASGILEDLMEIGMVAKVFVDRREQEFGFMPAIDTNTLTVNELLKKLSEKGSSDFIPGFDKQFKSIADAVDRIEISISESDSLIKDLKIIH